MKKSKAYDEDMMELHEDMMESSEEDSDEDEAELEISVSLSPQKPKSKPKMVKKAKGGMVKNYSKIARPQKFSGIF